MKKSKVKIGERFVGDGEPVYIIAEIGINHNGSLEIAKKLIEGAVEAGCDAVKFQKRTPEICVPPDQWYNERETPWGVMSYIEYRHKVEFSEEEYAEINRYCKDKDIHWFASAWDEESVEFLEQFNPVAYKSASAVLTDENLLLKMREKGKPIFLSTGMSTIDQIERAIALIGHENLLIAQSTSSYPCKLKELNLRVIKSYKEKFSGIPIGYSGHETGLASTYAAVALGATFIERHITLDRAMWGSDQAASVEVQGFERLVRNIRDIENALGDGIKKVYDSEKEAIKKLRKITTP
ncbi:MAG: N-acetylneuraminate synthase [Ignavibacteria bacterium RBG_13_36_8]|nr:MAG: N-acetylneuraminate synthase [Ignavibacteria bacterium RBG_13_36_8]